MTTTEIIDQAMKKFPKAKRIAVENASMGVTEMDMAFQMNLEADCRAYNWNGHTMSAIRWTIGQNYTASQNKQTVDLFTQKVK